MLARFFIDRPIFAVVISIFIVIAGLAAAWRRDTPLDLAVVGAAPRIDVADGPAEHTGAIPTMPPPATR